MQEKYRIELAIRTLRRQKSFSKCLCAHAAILKAGYSVFQCWL